MTTRYEALKARIELQLRRYAVTRKPKDFPSASDIMTANRLGVRRRLDSMMHNLAIKWGLV